MRTPKSYRFKDRIAEMLNDIYSIFESKIDQTELVSDLIQRRHLEIESTVGPARHDSIFRAIWACKQLKDEAYRVAFEEVKKGLASGRYEVSSRGVDEVTPLMAAARGTGDLRLTELLLDEGAEINAECHYRNTALILAISEQSRNEENLPIIELLLKRGAWPFTRPSLFNGMDAYHWALDRGMESTARLIQAAAKGYSVDDVVDHTKAKRAYWDHYQAYEVISETINIQGRPWRDIGTELKKRGAKDDEVTYFVRRLGVWRGYAETLSHARMPLEGIASALRDAYASWPDVALTLAKISLTPEMIIRALIPMIDESNGWQGTKKITVAAAIYEWEGDLSWLPAALIEVDMDPDLTFRHCLHGVKWANGIRKRMGFPLLNPETGE